MLGRGQTSLLAHWGVPAEWPGSPRISDVVPLVSANTCTHRCGLERTPIRKSAAWICFHAQLSHHHSSANVPLLLPLLRYLISSTLLLLGAQLETLKCSFSFQPLHIWPSKRPAVTPRPVQLHLEQNPTASRTRSDLLQSKWCGLPLWFYWDQNRGPDRFRLFHVHKTHTVEHPPEDKAPVKGPPPGQKPLCSLLDFSSVNLALCSAST